MWNETKLEYVAKKIAMGPFGSNIKVSSFVNEGVPIISGAHLHGTRVVDGDNKFITLEHAQKLKNSNVFRGDVIFTHAGNIGQVAYIPKNSKYDRYVISQRQFYLRCDKSKLLPEFITLYFHSPIGRHLLLSNASQVGVPSIARPSSYLKSLSIPIPSILEQKKIVSVLASLNDKIENNLQMNETMQEMARSIFKSWFIDFDPVHAKVAGNKPVHMDADTAALFPSSFGDNGLPEGFISKNLKDSSAEIESGRRPKGGIDKSLGEGIPSIGAESIQNIGKFDYSKVKFVEKEFAEKSSRGWVQNYDVAIYKDGANVGDSSRVGLFGYGFPFDKFMVNEHVFLLRSKDLGQPFLYSLCQSEMFSHQLKSMGTSKAAQPGLNQQEVLSCKYIAPPQVLSLAFNKLISPLIDRRLSLGLENQTLAELHNTLLPKLISGEIRLKDAEREVEAAI